MRLGFKNDPLWYVQQTQHLQENEAVSLTNAKLVVTEPCSHSKSLLKEKQIHRRRQHCLMNAWQLPLYPLSEKWSTVYLSSKSYPGVQERPYLAANGDFRLQSSSVKCWTLKCSKDMGDLSLIRSIIHYQYNNWQFPFWELLYCDSCYIDMKSRIGMAVKLTWLVNGHIQPLSRLHQHSRSVDECLWKHFTFCWI